MLANKWRNIKDVAASTLQWMINKISNYIDDTAWRHVTKDDLINAAVRYSENEAIKKAQAEEERLARLEQARLDRINAYTDEDRKNVEDMNVLNKYWRTLSLYPAIRKWELEWRYDYHNRANATKNVDIELEKMMKDYPLLWDKFKQLDDIFTNKSSYYWNEPDKFRYEFPAKDLWYANYWHDDRWEYHDTPVTVVYASWETIPEDMYKKVRTIWAAREKDAPDAFWYWMPNGLGTKEDWSVRYFFY